jgi:hypothetical protein
LCKATYRQIVQDSQTRAVPILTVVSASESVSAGDDHEGSPHLGLELATLKVAERRDFRLGITGASTQRSGLVSRSRPKARKSSFPHKLLTITTFVKKIPIYPKRSAA